MRANHIKNGQQRITGILHLLLSRGFGKTLDELCTISAFSVLSTG